MPFNPTHLMQTLSKVATAGNNFYQGGWGGGKILPMPQFGEDTEDQPQSMPIDLHELIHGGSPDAPASVPNGFWSGTVSPPQPQQMNFLQRFRQGAAKSLPDIISKL